MTTETDDTKALVMEIERFAIHDGPGIRSVVFLQGCPLHCPWCSNPESQKMMPHLMHLSNRCVGCGACVKACPQQAIELKEGKSHINRTLCNLCAACEEVCPQDAIKMVGHEMSASEIMALLLRDADYYRHSNGGVTFSGGESFVQFDALIALLKCCKDHSIHTAVETCGQVALSKIRQAFDSVDLFLFDIKQTSASLLKQVTGADWDVILTNLDWIAQRDPSKVILRVPVIPGFNFSEAYLEEVFHIALARHISTVHLLPYHTLGMDKYKQLDMSYPFDQDKMLSKSSLIPYKLAGEQMGLDVKIGG